MQLQPHVCDFEWLHSATLGWVELENVDPNAENVDYWMRMSERFDEITFVIKNSSDLRRECLQHGSSDTRCDSSEKMRFMGLRSADIMFLSDDSPQEIVTEGKQCGLCTPEVFSYGGIGQIQGFGLKKYADR